MPILMCECVYIYTQSHMSTHTHTTHMCVVCVCVVRSTYGVASISRLLEIIGLFCKRAQLKRLYSAKETYILKEPTHRSHPILGKCQF